MKKEQMDGLKKMLQNESLKDRWELIATANGVKNPAAAYAAECEAFLMAIIEATKDNYSESLYSHEDALKMFQKAALSRLSWNAHAKHMYIIPEMGRLQMAVSPYGEAFMRIVGGVIKEYSDPALVYACDTFRVVNGVPQHEQAFPRDESSPVIAVYVHYVTANNRDAYTVFGIDEIKKFMNRGIEKNTRPRRNESDADNAARKEKTADDYAGKYSEPGMIKAKALKHAMSRLPVWQPAALSADTEELGATLSGIADSFEPEADPDPIDDSVEY